MLQTPMKYPLFDPSSCNPSNNFQPMVFCHEKNMFSPNLNAPSPNLNAPCDDLTIV